MPRFHSQHTPSSEHLSLPMAPHACSKKSPAEQLATLQPGDMWLVNTVAWDATADQLLLGVRHYEAGTGVKSVKATEPMLASMALWWATLTGSLQPLDAKNLLDRDPTHYWGTY